MGMLPRMGWLIALLFVGAVVGAPGAHAQAPAEAAVGEHLGLFLALPDRRESHEKVTLTQERLEIWFLRAPETQAARARSICDGARWLLTGRLANSTGAKGLFAALPELQEITLIFYALDTKVSPDRDGKYVQSRSPQPTARFTIRRETASQLNLESLRKTLTGARCPTLAETVLDSVWTP